jgi:hypothetical protein
MLRKHRDFLHMMRLARSHIRARPIRRRKLRNVVRKMAHNLSDFFQGTDGCPYCIETELLKIYRRPMKRKYGWRNEKTLTRVVHAIKWASQPEVQFACEDTTRIPDYDNTPEMDKEKIWKAGGEWYSFEKENVTCPKCEQLGYGAYIANP